MVVVISGTWGRMGGGEDEDYDDDDKGFMHGGEEERDGGVRMRDWSWVVETTCVEA